MLKCALAAGLLAIAALPVSAQTPIPVAVRTGTPTGATGSSGVNSYAVSWTQASANYNPTITLTLQSTGGAATATVYLTNKIGAGTTAATNQIATGTLSVSSGTPTSAPVTWTTPTPILLPGATYYLVVSNMNAAFQWAFVLGGATETTIAGTTYSSDLQDLAGPVGYAPAATTFVPVIAGVSSHVLLFSVSAIPGTPPAPPSPSGVPTLGTFGMVGTGTLLAFAGILFLKRQPANPLR